MHIILSLENEDYWDTWNYSLKKNYFRIGPCPLCRCRPTAVPAERSEAYQLQAACNLSIVQQDVQLSSESVSSPSAEAHTSAANANNALAKYGGESGILRHIGYVIFPYCQRQPQARVNSITTSPASRSEVL